MSESDIGLTPATRRLLEKRRERPVNRAFGETMPASEEALRAHHFTVIVNPLWQNDK